MKRLPDIDLKLLRLLVQLYACRSVSRTAEALQLSQPATSLALGRLRRILKDPLFVRGSGEMLPTSRCEEIVVAAEEALALVDNVIQGPVEFDPRTAQRTFLVTSSDVGEMTFLPPIMAHLSKFAPDCNLETRAWTAQELPGAMERGQVELAVGFFPDLERPGFYMQRIYDHRFVCLVRKDHPKISSDTVPMDVFLALSHVVVEPEGRSNELFEQLLQSKGLSRRVQLSIPHFLSVPAIISATDMIVTVPFAVADYFCQLGENVRIVNPPINTDTYVLKQHWHARLHHDPALRWLRGEIARIFIPQIGTQSRYQRSGQ